MEKYMKTFKTIILASALSLSIAQTSNAAVTSIAFMGGAFGVAAKYALITIGWNYPASKIHAKNPLLGKLLFIPGFLLLDEDSESLAFKEISSEDASVKDITKNEMMAFNNEIDEVNLVFSEVVSQVSSDMTKEEVKGIWMEYGEYLSNESLNALKKIVR